MGFYQGKCALTGDLVGVGINTPENGDRALERLRTALNAILGFWQKRVFWRFLMHVFALVFRLVFALVLRMLSI